MNWMKGLTIILAFFIVSGCMYPQEQRSQVQPPSPEQLAIVQEGVDRFQEDTGVLPIMTVESDTPLYHKYVIDFKRMIPRYLAEPPANSFEGGGVFRYVLVNVEEDPTVRLFDLRLARQVGDVQRRINMYMTDNRFLPTQDILGSGYFTMDHSKLNLNGQPTVRSPYTQQNLPLIIDQNGVVGIDYRIDLHLQIQSMADVSLNEGEDIRHLLVTDHAFVPAYSFPVTIKDGEPALVDSWDRSLPR